VIAEAKHDRNKAQEASLAAEASLASVRSENQALQSQLTQAEKDLQAARDDASKGHTTDIQEIKALRRKLDDAR